jgi:APA family basic amino acid/polyamine antiporter
LAEQRLHRVLGRSFSIAACVGTVIGLGILRTPGEIAATIQSPALYMMLWLGGGLFVLLSTLVVAELIGMSRKSGGPYVMIAHAYGPYPGFLLGWADWLSQCAAAALKAVVLMEYAALLFPALAPFKLAGALLINSAIALLQTGGVRLSGGVFQVAAAGFAILLAAVTLAILLGGDAGAVETGGGAEVIRLSTEWAHYGLVVAAIVFTYDGWVGASYYNSEVDGGGRSAARGSVKGILLVIVLYLLLNGVLVLKIPLAALAGHELALAAALGLLYGEGAGLIITGAALFILLAHQNIQYMAASRTLYALSVDGLASRRATGVSKRGTPTGALFASWLLMAGLILAGGFEFLLNMCALLFIVLYIALVVGVFRLRRIEPDRKRPFRAWGFPVTGVVCAVGWVAVAVFVALMDPRSSLYALGLTAVSIPAYLMLRARRQP